MPENAPSPTPSDDVFSALADGPEHEIKIKASRFIGQAWTTRTEDEARAQVEAVRRRYHDSRHVCWAFRLAPTPADGPVLERFDDDGEPNGTAGTPILNAIGGAGTWFTAVTVVRYFGGTKLGAGGLARAYGESAKLALDAAPRLELCREVTLHVTTTFDDVGLLEAILGRRGHLVRRVDRDFDPQPTFAITVARTNAQPLHAEIVEGTAGRAAIATDEVRLKWPSGHSAE